MAKRNKSSESSVAVVENTENVGTVENVAGTTNTEKKTRQGALGFRLFNVTDGACTPICEDVFPSQPDVHAWLRSNPQPHGMTIAIYRISAMFSTTPPQRTVSKTVYRKM